MSDNQIAQLSDITPGNDASVSSSEDEAQVLQLIQEEVHSAEDRARNSLARDPRKSKFLEDYGMAIQENHHNDLSEALLDKSKIFHLSSSEYFLKRDGEPRILEKEDLF